MTKPKGWVLSQRIDGTGKVLHGEVIPKRDLRAHVTGWKAKTCWCKPDVQVGTDDSPLYGHNALDGRELVEQHGIN